MKLPVIPRYLFVGLGAVLFSTAAPIAAAAESTLSPAALEKLRSVTSPYSPAQHARAEATKAAANSVLPDPDVVALPPVTVLAHTLRRLHEDSLYQHGAFDKELVKRELSTFDRCFLNRFTLPLFGISKEARARQAYLERKNREFYRHANDLARVAQLVNSDEAAALRASLVQ